MRRLFLVLFFLSRLQAATLVSKATGNFTASTTWGPAETASLLDSEANTIVIGTSNIDTATFVPAGTAIIGMAVKLNARAASPAGTCDFILRNSTTATNVATVTVNVSDFPAEGNGWHFLKFSSSHTPNGTDTYLGRAVCTNTGSQITLYRNATANNWSRVLVQTTNTAPGAADHLICSGAKTGAGAMDSYTVTMDSTSAATTYGATSFTESIAVSQGCTFANGTAAATNYALKWAGIFKVYGGGTWNVGTSGTRIPANSTATYTMSVASNVDSGIDVGNGGIVNVYGATERTRCTLLTADLSAAATTVTVATTAGWAANDVLAFAPTTRTASQFEKKTIQSVDSGTQVTLTAGATNAHSGTSPTQAEVCNLTRNVLFTGTSASLQGYALIDVRSTTNISYAEFNNFGSGTANKRGIDFGPQSGTITTTSTVVIDSSSLHDFSVSSSFGFSLTTSNSIALNGTFALSNNTIYNTASSAISGANTITGAWQITGNTIFGSAGVSWQAAGNGASFSNNTISGSTGSGFLLGLNSGSNNSVTFDNLTSHSNAAQGVITTNLQLQTYTFNNLTVWRNNNTGLDFQHSTVHPRLVVNNSTFFGNLTQNINLGTGAQPATVLLTNVVSNGDTTFSTTNGLLIAASSRYVIRLINCNFSTVSGIKTAHTNDINFSANPFSVDLIGDHTKLGAATPLASYPTNADAWGGSSVVFFNYGQVAGDHRNYKKYGFLQNETTTYRSTPSVRATPNNATNKIEGGGATVAVKSGNTVTVKAYVRKSTAGDSCGADYTGNQLRLVVKQAYACGITADTVLATGSAATGTWEQLTGVTAAVTSDCVLRFVVDGDGTAGCFYHDDWTLVGTPAAGGTTFWRDGEGEHDFGGNGGAAGGGSCPGGINVYGTCP